MKVIKIVSKPFGIGSNPGGGVHISFIPETDEERALYIDGTYSSGFGYITVYEQLTIYPGDGRIPMDGGSNLAWKNIEKYIEEKYDMDLIKWAKQVQEEHSKEYYLEVKRKKEQEKIKQLEYKKKQQLVKIELAKKMIEELRRNKEQFITWKSSNGYCLYTVDGHKAIIINTRNLIKKFFVESNARYSNDVALWLQDKNKKKITKEEFFKSIQKEIEVARENLEGTA